MKRSTGPVLFALSVLFLLSCGSRPVRPLDDYSPNSPAASGPALPEIKDFTGEGKAPDFADARNAAYVDLIRRAVIFTIGENAFSKNRTAIEESYMSYVSARKFILGEGEKSQPGKEKKWLSTSRDSSGNLVLKLQAYVNLKKLQDDLSTRGLAGQDTPARPEDTAVKTPVSDSPSSASPESADLSGVDVSALTFLVFYNSGDPAAKRDNEQQTYAKWAVDNLNRELASLDIQTFDVDTVEKLSRERALIQESTTGNVGIGLLLAQKVFAELYAEVSPAVSYEGTKGHAIVSIKVYVRTTGALIASIEKGGQQYDSVSLSASIKKSMKEAVQKAMPELAAGLKKYVNNGRFYFVRLSGVSSYRDASQFASAVAKLDGVVNMRIASGSRDDRVYDYSLQFRGNPTEAVDRLFSALEGRPGFEKFDLKQIRGNELIFTLE